MEANLIKKVIQFPWRKEHQEPILFENFLTAQEAANIFVSHLRNSFPKAKAQINQEHGEDRGRVRILVDTEKLSSQEKTHLRNEWEVGGFVFFTTDASGPNIYDRYIFERRE